MVHHSRNRISIRQIDQFQEIESKNTEMKTEPNHALQTMPMLVTSAAAHLPRQARACLI
jgi:hypothetical protein